MALLFLSLKSPLEFFVPTALLSFVCFCAGSEELAIPIIYGGYGIVPLMVIALYKKALLRLSLSPERRIPTLYHILCTLFTIVTFVMSFLWAGVMEVADHKHQWMWVAPGIVALWIGTFLGVTSNLTEIPIVKNQKSLGGNRAFVFSVTVFDYWWIVVCQVGSLFFQGQDQVVFLNMLIVSLLPFSLYTWQRARRLLEKRQDKTWVHWGVGIMSVFLVIPFAVGILYTLLGPWINKEKPRGNS